MSKSFAEELRDQMADDMDKTFEACTIENGECKCQQVPEMPCDKGYKALDKHWNKVQ